jgi:hypothetical protein
MHDPKYRLDVAWQNVAYNQPPHPGFFLGAGMAEPPIPPIYTVQFVPPIGDYNANGAVEAADYTLWRKTLGSATDLRADGNRNGVVDQADYELWRANFGHESAPAIQSNPVSKPAVQTAHPFAATLSIASDVAANSTSSTTKSKVVPRHNISVVAHPVRDELLIAARRQFAQNSYDENAEVVDSSTPKRGERFRREEIAERAFEELVFAGSELDEVSLRARDK